MNGICVVYLFEVIADPKYLFAFCILKATIKRAAELIVGTNLGGLGTLIASMASLISYRQITAADASCRKKYILIFTVFNLVFLAILYQIR